jgi:hypothetical protein
MKTKRSGSSSLSAIKRRSFRKRVSATKKYRSKRSNVIGGGKQIYVLYLVSGSGPANERTGIKNRVLDICGVSENKNSMLRAATDIPDEMYNVENQDPILNNLYIDTITLGKGVNQQHKFEKVDLSWVKKGMASDEIPYVDITPEKYHITINPTSGLVETITANSKNCPIKDGEKVKNSYTMVDNRHCIWSEGLTYMFEYDYTVSGRSEAQTENIVHFNYTYNTDFE